MALLLDTNVISELRKRERCNPSLTQWFSTVQADDVYVSVLTVGKIRRGIEVLHQSDIRGAAALDRWPREIEHRYGDRIWPVTLEICRIWGGMSIDRPLAPIDGLMAATAVHHWMTLVEDVERSGVDVLDPFAAA